MKQVFLTGLAIAALTAQPALADGARSGLIGTARYIPCPENTNQFGGVIGAIAGVLIGPLIEAGIKGLGNALASAGEPKQAQVTAATSDSFYATAAATKDGMPLTLQHGCLAVAAGVAGGDGVAITPSDNDVFGGGLALVRESFTKRPSVFMQGQLEVAADRSAWRFVPTYLWTGTAMTTGNAARDLVITLSVHSPAASEDGGVIAARSITIRRVTNNKSYSAADLPKLATTWMPLPALSDAVKTRIASAVQRIKDIDALKEAKTGYDKDAIDSAKTPVQRAAAKELAQKAQKAIDDLIVLAGKDSEALALVAPVTFTFNINETADGNKFLAGLGKLLAGKAAEIAAPVAASFDPEKRADAAIAAADKEDGLRIAAITAVETWQASKAAGDSVAKQSVARIGAKGACRTLELRGFYETACLEVG